MICLYKKKIGTFNYLTKRLMQNNVRLSTQYVRDFQLIFDLYSSHGLYALNDIGTYNYCTTNKLYTSQIRHNIICYVILKNALKILYNINPNSFIYTGKSLR